MKSNRFIGMEKKKILFILAVIFCLIILYGDQDSNLKTKSCNFVDTSLSVTEYLDKIEQEIKIEGFYSLISKKEHNELFAGIKQCTL
jgi:predicted RND superfamily exporter protein